MKNKNITTYIIVFLILLNIGTLAVFWFFRPPQPPPRGAERERIEKTNDFIRREVGWNEEQFRIFQRSRDELHRASSSAVAQAGLDRQALVEALLKSPPDTALAWKLAGEIGFHERAIQENLIGHYLQLWTMSEAEQREQLSRVFRKTLRPARQDESRPGPGRRK